jgi:hypothetical protein
MEAVGPGDCDPGDGDPGDGDPGDGDPRAMRTRRDRRNIEGKPINQMEEKFYKEGSNVDEHLACGFG